MKSTRKSPWVCFLLGAVLSIPLVLFAGVEVLPNVALIRLGAPIPMAAALVLVSRENGIAGAKELFK